MEQTSRRFREGLRRELPRWTADGLVSPDAAAALHARYRLGEPEAVGPSLLAVYVLGALLVGAGVVSLAAWHWEALPAAGKLGILGGALLACHAGGFTLWKGTGRAPRLGHAVALLGTLVFGASIGLVAQIFHVSGAWWSGFALFAAGALAAGLLYRSLPHLLLAAALAFGIAGPGFAGVHPLGGVAAAWGLAALLAALAWRERSRALAVVIALGLAVPLVAALAEARLEAQSLLAIACLAAMLAAAPLAAAPFAARSDTGARLAGAARVTGRLGFYLAAYPLSFHELARSARLLDGVPALLLAAALPALLLAAAALATGLRRPEVDSLARGEALLVGAAAISLGLGLSLDDRGAAAVANLSLALLAAGRIARGLSSLVRGPFWEGIAIAGLLVIGRSLELETHLWLKGAAFIACGAAVIVGGVAFERQRARAATAPHVG
jgi:hypothetical protein